MLIRSLYSLDAARNGKQRRTMIDDVKVIIRSSGERTEAACKQIPAKQVRIENISVIHESPFSKAVEATFRLGTEADKKWTLAVDADILLTATAVQDIVKRAEKKSGKTFIYQGCVLDKLFNCV